MRLTTLCFAEAAGPPVQLGTFIGCRREGDIALQYSTTDSVATAHQDGSLLPRPRDAVAAANRDVLHDLLPELSKVGRRPAVDWRRCKEARAVDGVVLDRQSVHVGRPDARSSGAGDDVADE